MSQKFPPGNKRKIEVGQAKRKEEKERKVQVVVYRVLQAQERI